MRRFVAAFLLLAACGSSASSARTHERTDVVSEAWTSGDDAPLTTSASR